MAAGNTDIIIARLEGFLKAFAWFNDKTNHGCSFSVYQIPRAADVLGALAAYFKLESLAFRIEPLVDFEQDLRAVFGRFLFLFQKPVAGCQSGDYLVDPQQSFNLMSEHGRNALLDELGSLVRSFGVTSAWRVVASPECGELREWCFQDDVVLELADRLCLVHFGVSD
jgi:hypothetical protein